MPPHWQRGYARALKFFQGNLDPIFISVADTTFLFHDSHAAALFFTASGHIISEDRFGHGPVGGSRFKQWHTVLFEVTKRKSEPGSPIILIDPKGQVFQHKTVSGAVTRLIKTAPFTIFRLGEPKPFSDSD